MWILLFQLRIAWGGFVTTGLPGLVLSNPDNHQTNDHVRLSHSTLTLSISYKRREQKFYGPFYMIPSFRPHPPALWG